MCVSDAGQLCFMRSWKVDPLFGWLDRSASEETGAEVAKALQGSCVRSLLGLALESGHSRTCGCAVTGTHTPGPARQALGSLRACVLPAQRSLNAQAPEHPVFWGGE